MLTCFALIAFAANSVLCRRALGGETIDAASFTFIRLLAGAVVLFIFLQIKRDSASSLAKGSWSASFMLFIYAVSFSYAYISLDTGTGALILFASVQITMLLVTVFSGNRLHASEWLGIVIAFTGFVYLIIPDITTPSVVGFLLMAIAGIAWGLYTLKGRASVSPLNDTAYNFIRTIPLLIVLGIISLKGAHITSEGIMLAVLSGALASGVGYSIWYAALGGLTSTQAAVLQLLVPIIAAAGGVVFVNEAITVRLMSASGLVLGGILIVVLGRYYFVQKIIDKK